MRNNPCLNPSRLPPHHEAELVEALTARFFDSTAAVIALIKTRCGVVYAKVGVIKFQHRLGFDNRTPKGLPDQGRRRGRSRARPSPPEEPGGKCHYQHVVGCGPVRA